MHAKGETRREDDQTGHDRYEGVQQADAHRLAGKRMLLIHIAAEDFHGSDTEAQRKERLVHSRCNDLAKSDVLHFIQAGNQVEADALLRSGKHAAVNRQNKNQAEQDQHHNFADLLDTGLQTATAHQEAQEYRNGHPSGHLTGRGQQISKYTAYIL